VVSRLRCALLVVMGLLVAGLVSATVITGASAAGHHAPRALVQSQAGAVSDPGLTGANRRAAVSDAATLLGYVVAPSGATVISQGTAIGWRDGHVITAAMASAVAYRSWTVAEDPASVLADVQAQLPAGSKILSTGSAGPTFSESVIRSWPSVTGVLDSRLLELQVTGRPDGATTLSAVAQSQWVVVRPRGEQLPSMVRDVAVTDGWLRKAPFFSRDITSRARVAKLVALFNSLGIVQPVTVNCPAETITPTVSIRFLTSAAATPVAAASVSAASNYSFSPSEPGAGCFAIALSVHGDRGPALVGNVIAPLQQMLHVKLNRQH
jgi:hypothetical protein